MKINRKKLNLFRRPLKYLSLLFLVFSLTLYIGSEKDETENNIVYEQAENWVSLPIVTKTVDVFYVYPTVSSNISGAMDINAPAERALAKGIFDAQASVFELKTNIFAPYYRQMSTKVDMSGGGLATDTDEFKQASLDVQNAFNYYIEKLNNNRPFIIAGHSQGTMALIDLIRNRFGDDEVLRKRLVVAYMIGYTVTDDDLLEAGLSPAQNATDVGVVITYNTQSVTSEGGPMLMAGALCINPLNWRTDSTPADSLLNLGAMFFNDETGEFIRKEDHYCGAQIDMEGPYSEGVYHRYDYAFWYKNIQQNVSDRIDAYFLKD